MGSVVREYRRDDLDAVLELAIAAWTPAFESMRTLLGDELFDLQHGDDWRDYQRASVERTLGYAAVAWVAEADGAVAGFVTAGRWGNEPIGEISMLAVGPRFQRRGIARDLIATAEEWMRAEGIPVAMVETGGDPGHAAARATYDDADYTALPVVRYFKAL